MSENLSAQFPNPPDLQPMPAPRSKIWQIISLALIIGGLVLLGTGGWMFYQIQLEASKPPPARILDPAEVLAEFEAAQTQTEAADDGQLAALARNYPDQPAQTGHSDTSAPEPAQPTKASELNPASSQSDPPPVLPDFAEDAAPAANTEAQAGDSEVTQNEASDQSEGLEAETVLEPATEPAENVPQPKPLSVAEAKFLEEAALNRQPTPTSTPETNVEAPPSLDENPLVVPEADLSASAEVPAAAPNSTPLTRIVAESIDLDADIVPVGWQQVIRDGVPTNIWTVADYAAGWHQNSALPGQGGNIVLSGHHNIKGEVFRYLVDIEVGDIISLYAGDQRYDYVVDDKFIVKDKGEPEAIRRANARWIGPFNEERLTLVTCWPYTNNTHRLIVIAKPL
jgi:sortase A